MTDRTWSHVERWALAIGAPVIASGVIAIATFMWMLHERQTEQRVWQSEVSYELMQIRASLDDSYTQQMAERDLTEVRRRLNDHDERLAQLEQD